MSYSTLGTLDIEPLETVEAPLWEYIVLGGIVVWIAVVIAVGLGC